MKRKFLAFHYRFVSFFWLHEFPSAPIRLQQTIKHRLHKDTEQWDRSGVSIDNHDGKLISFRSYKLSATVCGFIFRNKM